MEFTEMRDLLNEHFAEMTKDTTHLFEVNLDKDEMWNKYLDAFPDGTNEIFRERRQYDCSCCRGFIKNIGNVVSIKNGVVTTIWDFETSDDVFAPVLKELSDYVKSHAISDVYMSKFKKIGCHHNFEMLENKSQNEWHHFFIELDDKFVIRDSRSKGDVLNEYRTTRNVFKRSLDEITMDALDMVIELVDSNTLYKGAEWKTQLKTFRELKKEYDLLSDDLKELYAWEKSVEVGPVIGKIRNHSIGVLLVDISEGKDLDQAVRSYEAIVAPSNYKRPKPIFTKKMLEDAENKIRELDYMDSLPRRFATLDDITINDVLFSNKDASSRIQGAESVFDELSKMAKNSNSSNRFSKVEEISIDKFLSDVLPTATSIEAYFENKHISNLVSLIAPVNKDSKPMFKWGSSMSWAYSGNMTDSMKDIVKSMGGKVDGDLRFSIQWNEDGKDNCDLDAHCTERFKDGGDNEIYYGDKRSHITKGQLDVDIIEPNGKIAVENITWANRNMMKAGTYVFYVNQFSGSVKNGFRAEIEFDGQIYSFDYPHSMGRKENVKVAEVTYDGNGNFEIKPLLDSNMASKEAWGIKTNEFIPVTVLCKSPNYWETAVANNGHEHIFFMLKGCVNDENPSGIFNEFLVQDLYEHRKVMAALGNKMRVTNTDDQLSGLGFALDKRNELVVKVTGATERVMKIKF